jgi:crossover junction endodeoxyribonuclease RusA
MTAIVRRIRHSFAVIGLPVSTQSSSKSKQQYKTTVAETASKSVVNTIRDNEKIKIEIDWFSAGFQNKPDVDNIIKPIQDALKGIVFLDDDQVESVICRKHDTLKMIRFMREPLCLIEPLMNGQKEYVFVRVY